MKYKATSDLSYSNKIFIKSLKLNIGLRFISFSISCSSNRITARGSDDVYFTSVSADNEITSYNQNTNSSLTDNNTIGQDNTNANNDADIQNVDDSLSNDNQGGNDGGSSSRYSGANGNTYITNNYYDQDDYYDYAYSARLRRFNHSYGWNYYDPYYTNLYWYDYNPYSYGVSV